MSEDEERSIRLAIRDREREIRHLNRKLIDAGLEPEEE